MRKHTILFLAANPSRTNSQSLAQEAHAIQLELERSRWRDSFEFVTWWAAEPLDLLRELRKLRPTVVQFNGHAGDPLDGSSGFGPASRREVVGALGPPDSEPCAGLFFQDPSGRPRGVSASALRETFEAAGSSVRLVVLSACYSEPATKALLAHVECVVGMAGTIRDDAARSFAVGFYGGLGERESVQAAFRGGCAAIGLNGLAAGDRPQLRARTDGEADRLILAILPPAPSYEPLAERSPIGVPPSTVKTTDGEPTFTGREAELEAIADRLRGGRVVVLHGAPGLGKSRLAREYARRHSPEYPGGMFFVPFEQSPPIELAKLLRYTARPAEPGEPIEDQCRRALRELGAAGRAIVIYDAIADERVLRDWLPYEGRDLHVIATSTFAHWARTWRRVDVQPLHADAERELVASILGEGAADRLVRRIVEKAGHVTVELCASAAAAYERVCLGDAVEDVAAELGDETLSSFESAWTLLSSDAQVALQIASTFVTARFPLSLVADVWHRLGMSLDAMARAIDTARLRQLATRNGDDLQVHQLVSRFVRARVPLSEPLRRSVLDGLLAIAREFCTCPGDLERRAMLLAHSPKVEDWATMITAGSEWLVVGTALNELGQYAEALRWFERAVTANEKGDVHGRVDEESLRTSLHQVGLCHFSLGGFTEAMSWFERAVAVAEKGDVHGRVNGESLGESIDRVGYCHLNLGQFAEALPWFERAATAKERGDLHSRVDAASRGISLHRVGYCHTKLGQFAEALSWYERAVIAKEKGDVHGRVDPANLGESVHMVGHCHWGLGRFAEALPWFERAVTAAEKGDVHGRVNAETLGVGLTMVGHCHWGLGRFAEALPWFERAVAAKEKGDVHGRVDPASLGESLGYMGDCYARQGQFAQALRWFERAVAAAEKGDAHGRVDPASLGRSLGCVGFCYACQGQFAQALPWFERAVAAKEKGDVHGRVDPASLGRSLHQVGDCYARQSQFAQALPWFERAVAAKEKGDVHGRVDPKSLGRSLGYLGDCYARQGQFAQALPWFERAVAAAEKGDVHGRVDSESLGRSLGYLGDCYARQGQFTQALPWFERAVAAAEKGDVHGRVDPASLGRSLHQVGDCYARQGQFAQALPWFERAVAAKEKGDVHGRVDPASLGVSLRQVGDCYARQGQFAQALPWFERATSVQEKADRT